MSRDEQRLIALSSSLYGAIKLRMESERRVVRMSQHKQRVSESLTATLGGSYDVAVVALMLQVHIKQVTNCQVIVHAH